ncbi:MAG: peptidoglycan-binding protein [Alphaproteobacteria bacterium]|nr:peptidoglycan-binding protein [Alphaproteobacteria bacterium]MBV9372033.1 peptidoglycan-binding protein [Alphaproteobacteria bacterium]MBV9902657.1 peptidoglycan-binding protein [Alphaproteobacteria bacterium]
MDFPGRIIKVGESDAAVVAHIAAGLAARGYVSTSPPGRFDARFKSLVRTFQSQNVDRAGQPLAIDGEVGALTWGALFGASVTAPTASSLAVAALGMAVTQLGVMEVPLGSNRGPMVDLYLASVRTPPGNFWCMAFVHWCFREAAVHQGVANPFPATAGCLDAWNRVKARQPRRLITRAAALADPSLVKPGHVFILDFGGGHGHAGFVRQPFAGPLRTVEGNTNPSGSSNGLGVFELNRRRTADTTLKGFIDFT